MLLLVLILVLGAFALLVVALVQGSVLWAWLSVVISVAAAGALLFDWWQRQQALRDEEALPPSPTVPDQSSPPQAVSADTDSVTEFIPVVSRQGQAPPQPEDETRFLPQEPATSVEPPVASEQTIVLPVARPPGSADQPSGATSSGPHWTERQSQSVTNAGSPPPVAPSHPTGGRPDPVPAGEETVLQPVDHRSGLGSGPQRTNGTPVGEGNPPPPPVGDRPPAGGLFAAPVAEDAKSTAPAQPPNQPVQQSRQQPPADEHGEPDATELAMPTLAPAGPDGEPPEEPLEPEAAGIVAGLDDEVVVVDERPRYHVEGCPFLPGRPVIPLPAREAVELGFTPCAWCGPNRVLAERHPAAAR